jgi:hypothetical protein
VEAWVLDLEETTTRAVLAMPSASRGKAALGEFAQTPPRRYQSQQVIWVPPPAEGIPTRLDTEHLTLSQPPIAPDEPTRGQPYHPSPGRADPSPNEPRGPLPPPLGDGSNRPRPPDRDLDIDLQ